MEAKYTKFKYMCAWLDAGFSLERSEAYSLGEKDQLSMHVYMAKYISLL